MAEIASRTALGGAMGDTFRGLVICGIRSDGNYIWRPAVLMPGTRATDTDVATGTESKYVDAEHLKTALDALNLTGELVGTADLLANLPAVPADASVDVKYHAWVSTGDVTDPRGLYVPDATFTTWELAIAMEAPVTIDSYERAVDGATLEAGKRYVVTGGTYNTPVTPTDGQFFIIKNDANLVTIGGGDLMRAALVGPLEIPDGTDISGFPIGPSLEYVVSYNATRGRWSAALAQEQVINLVSAHSGLELRGGVQYVIENDSPGTVFRLPQTPAGILSVRLANGSSHPITIEDFDTADGTDQIRFEGDTVNNNFIIDVSRRGQKVEIVGDPGTGHWNVYRPWIIDDVNNNNLPWQANTAYTVSQQVQQNRLSDGVLTNFAWDDSANNGGTPTDGTSGATWDATEEARWIELGAAALNLEILQSVEVSVTGVATSFTVASALVLVDAAGNDYDSATDWIITADSAGGLGDGRFLGANGFNPPVNGTRTLTLSYVGSSTRRGLSAVRANFRTSAASTGFSQIRLKYFSGITAQATGPGAVAQAPYTWDFDDFDFLTDPQAPTETVLDSAAPWDTNADYTADEPFIITIPATVASGPFVTLDGTEMEADTRHLVSYAADRTATDSVPTIADDAASVAEVLLMNYIGAPAAPEISLGYLRPVDRVVSDPDPIPTAGVGNERFMYQGVTTSSIYEFDASGSNPALVTDPGATDWVNGVRVLDTATGDLYQYDRGSNRFNIVPVASAGWLTLADGGTPEPNTGYRQTDAAHTWVMPTAGFAENDTFSVARPNADGDLIPQSFIFDGTAFQELQTENDTATDGLRGEPVADTAALTALAAREYERRMVKDTGDEYVFKLTADLTTDEDASVDNLADDTATGKWIRQQLSADVLGDVVFKLNEWTGSVGISNGALTTVDTEMDWSAAETFEITVADSAVNQNHKTYRGDVSMITGTTGQSLLIDRFGSQYIWVTNLNLATGVFQGQIASGSGWAIKKVTLYGSKTITGTVADASIVTFGSFHGKFTTTGTLTFTETPSTPLIVKQADNQTFRLQGGYEYVIHGAFSKNDNVSHVTISANEDGGVVATAGSGGANHWKGGNSFVHRVTVPAGTTRDYTFAVVNNGAVTDLTGSIDIEAQRLIADGFVLKSDTLEVEPGFSQEILMPYNSATDPGYTASNADFTYPTQTFTVTTGGKHLIRVMPYQTTTSLENGTRIGGIFNLRDSSNAVVKSLFFREYTWDATYTELPFPDGAQEILVDLPADTYTLQFTGHGGVGSGNRNSASGYVQCIVTRQDPKTIGSGFITNLATATAGQVLTANGDGTATFV